MNIISQLNCEKIAGGKDAEKPPTKPIPDCWLQPPEGWGELPNCWLPPEDGIE